MSVLMNGLVRFCSKKFPSYALNAYGTSPASGQNICLFKKDLKDKAQQFVFHSQGNGIYKLACVTNPKLVLDHYRVEPVDNCDLYTSASSSSTGALTTDLKDQQLIFDTVSGVSGGYTIRLQNSSTQYLTCSATADGKGCAKPSSNANLAQKNNVYWASKLTGTNFYRQVWIMERVYPESGATLLAHSHLYCQRDNTWAYLTTAGEFDSLRCGIAACAMVTAIMEKSDSVTPRTMQNRGVFKYGNVEPLFSNISTKFSDNPKITDSSKFYTTMRAEIYAGRPVFIRVQKPGFQHWVVAYGFARSTTALNAEPSRFYILDPYNPENTRLSDLLANSSMLHIKTVSYK